MIPRLEDRTSMETDGLWIIVGADLPGGAVGRITLLPRSDVGYPSVIVGGQRYDLEERKLDWTYDT